MKYRYVFVLGRSVCGKSAFYRQLEALIRAGSRHLTMERVDNYPKLWARLTADDAREAQGIPVQVVDNEADGEEHPER